MDGPRTRAAAYHRVSTEEQQKKQSIETQREEVRRYAETQDYDLVDEYSDDGISGTVPVALRPEGARLLADAQEEKFAVVLIYKLDRLGRDAMVTLGAMQQLQALGIQVVCITQGFDFEDPVGKLLATILSGV